MAVTDDDRSAEWSIRCAAAEDYDEIAAVWTSAGLPVSAKGRDRRDAFVGQIAQFPDLYLVAVAGERIVGVVLGTHDGRKGWINRLAVDPAWRGRGIARALIQTCDEAIRRHGIGIVSALVDPGNEASCRLFASAGFMTDVEVRYFRKRDHKEV